jgi:hypothetical protein
MRLLTALVIVVSTSICLVLAASPVGAQRAPEFRLGFKSMAEAIPKVVGEPIEEEHWGANGDSLQRTTTGLMVWRKADNWTAFTNGTMTWLNGPDGVQDRPNASKFDWEADTQPEDTPAPSAHQQGSTGSADSSAATPTSRSYNPNPESLKVSIDTPSDGVCVGPGVKIVGWALSTKAAGASWSGIDDFKLFLDGPEGSGRQLPIRVTRQQRSDVAGALGNPSFVDSGFTIEAGQGEVPQGRHDFFVYVHSAPEGWYWKKLSVVEGPIPPPATGWSVSHKPGDGYGIALPPGWIIPDIQSRDALIKASRELLPRPEFKNRASELNATMMSLMAIRSSFFGVDLGAAASGDNSMTYVNVRRTRQDPKLSLDDFGKLATANLEVQLKTERLLYFANERVRLPAGDAEMFLWGQNVQVTSGVRDTVVRIEYDFLHNGMLYSVSFATPERHLGDFGPVAEKIAGSFYLIE